MDQQLFSIFLDVDQGPLRLQLFMPFRVAWKCFFLFSDGIIVGLYSFLPNYIYVTYLLARQILKITSLNRLK